MESRIACDPNSSTRVVASSIRDCKRRSKNNSRSGDCIITYNQQQFWMNYDIDFNVLKFNILKLKIHV